MTDTRFSSLLEAVNGGNEMNRASKKRIGLTVKSRESLLYMIVSLEFLFSNHTSYVYNRFLLEIVVFCLPVQMCD